MRAPLHPDFSVVSPAFNEAGAIGMVVTKWIQVLEAAGREWEIVVCDDGSGDGTGAVLAGLNDPRVRVVRFEVNHGYGHALSAAIAAARGRYLITIDSDGQFELGDALPMVEKMEREQLDLVTGRRTKKQDSRLKVAGDRILNRIVRALFKLDFADTNCALKVIRAERAAELRIEALGFPTPTEIVVRASRAGLRIGETPVGHYERREGFSKLKTLASARDFMLFLIYLRLQSSLADRRVIKAGPA